MGGPHYDELLWEQIDRLRTSSLRRIEDETIRKRLAWLAEHGLPARGSRLAATPRQAFEQLFFDYMGLRPADLEVVSESAVEIVWRSTNPCPTLDACCSLKLDTRRVCRGAYEKSTQAFLSQLDPELRFLRSYSVIRPHAAYCEERIVRVNFLELMRAAIEEAKRSRQTGNKGYGAVVALGSDVLARAHDTAASEKDPSLHAEMNAIRAAVRVTGDSNLSGAVLVSSCEPCPMCSSLAVWANLTTIVYGASIEETARQGKARIRVGAAEVVERSPVFIEVIGGVLEEECCGLYLDR